MFKTSGRQLLVYSATFVIYTATFIIRKKRVRGCGRGGGGGRVIGLPFSLLRYFSNTKNMFSKQAGTCFWVYSATFVTETMHFQKSRGSISGRLLFSLFRYFCHLDTCMSKSRETLLFSYLFTFAIWKHVCSNQEGGCFCNIKNVCLKQAGGCFLVYWLTFSYEIYKNFHEVCFLNGCSLVYLANYIKLTRTADF